MSEQIEAFPELMQTPWAGVLRRDQHMTGAPRHARNPADLYETPEWCTEVLCRHVKFDVVWEPGCGPGKMVRVLEKHVTLAIRCSDLIDYGWGHEVRSFFDFHEDWAGDIVTNPPYGKVQDKFIRHALELTKKHGGKVAMLLRNEFDCAAKRADLFDPAGPFALKIVLTKRPRWVPGSKGSPRHNYAWFVWDWSRTAPSTTLWDQ